MSRAATLRIAEHQATASALTPQAISDTIWTGPIDTTTLRETYLSKAQSTSGFEIGHLLAGQARSATPDLLPEEDPWEEDLCIEMPPRSVEKVVINVKDMGRAKPLPFDLDDVLEEEDPWEEEDPYIEMPSCFVREVVVDVRYMGRAKPLEYLDDILEEE
jgi:hypothetical protein